jgi:LPXTG-motif cell wall-anchored protein
MNARRLISLGVALSCLFAAAATPPAVAQQAGPGSDAKLEISTSKAQVSTRLGERFDFVSTIENAGRATVSGLVAHLNVVGLDQDIYVDPEDWSEDRTKFLEPLAPGESTKVSWSVKAVTGGDAAIYVVALPDGGSSHDGDLAVSPAIQVRIEERRTINSGGVLPLALGIPALLGLAALVVRKRRNP